LSFFSIRAVSLASVPLVAFVFDIARMHTYLWRSAIYLDYELATSRERTTRRSKRKGQYQVHTARTIPVIQK
jgi:hypothetical protein